MTDFKIVGDSLQLGSNAPLAAGDHVVTIRCTDNNGVTVDKDFTITVVAGAASTTFDSTTVTFDDTTVTMDAG